MSEDVIDTIDDMEIKTEPLDDDDQGDLKDSSSEPILKVEPDYVACQIKIEVSETQFEQQSQTQSICKVEPISDMELEQDNTCDASIPRAKVLSKI